MRGFTRLAALGMWCGAAAPAMAAEQFLFTQQDPAVQSFFSIDFGPMGGVAEAEVADTQFLLKLDHVSDSAAFLRYHQHVDPLILPGGISTGDITVTVVPGTSRGKLHSDGTFETEEDYSIAFTGDLRPYGLTSPVILPSKSNGTIRFETTNTGRIELIWNGEGELANPFNPGVPIPFSYQCRVDTLHHVVTAGDLNCDGEVNAFDVEPFISALLDPQGYQQEFVACDPMMGDMNGDRRVDAHDIEPFIDALTP